MLTPTQKNVAWFIYGSMAFDALQAGNLAEAINIIRRGTKMGVFEGADDWRAAILIHCDLGSKEV